MMRDDEIDRWLGELGEQHRSVDAGEVMARFRARLDHLAARPSGWDRIDELAARVLRQEPPASAAPGHVPAAGALAPAQVAHDRLSEVLGGSEVLVRVLGDVVATRVAGTGVAGPDSEGEMLPGRSRTLEAITLLALRELPVDRAELEADLFPAGVPTEQAFDDTISAARALLGDELLPPPEGGRYALSPAVVTDYGVFAALATEADGTDDAQAVADRLRDALSLVRGEPLTGAGRVFPWAEPYRRSIVARVVDAAEELAEAQLATGEWRMAEWAARQGLRTDPGSEVLYRVLMRCARAAGNIPAVRRVYRELCDVLAERSPGVDPEDVVDPETLEVLERR